MGLASASHPRSSSTLQWLRRPLTALDGSSGTTENGPIIPKVFLHQLRPALGDAKIREHIGHYLLHVGWANTAECVRLQILVQQFIRIQFRAVRRQPEQPDSRRLPRSERLVTVAKKISRGCRIMERTSG